VDDDLTTAPAPSAGLRASLSLLRRNRDFRALFFASVISLGGDWFLWVAINGLIYVETRKALYVGLAILAQEFAFFLASPIGGVLADRLDRRKLMIVCDLARALICVAFLLVGSETLWLAYVLLPLLAAFAAPFDPAFSAATPNVVDPEDLAAANALNGSLWGTMLAVGAGLGGVISAAFGADTAFLVDAVSFLVSAALLSSIRRRFSESRREHTEHPGAVEATRETWRFARRDHRVLSLLAVKFGFGAAAGLLALIPVMALDVFASGNVGFGILMAARGVGALIGPFLGHRIAGPGHRQLFPAIGLSLAVFGLGYMAVILVHAGLWLQVYGAGVTVRFGEPMDPPGPTPKERRAFNEVLHQRLPVEPVAPFARQNRGLAAALQQKVELARQKYPIDQSFGPVTAGTRHGRGPTGLQPFRYHAWRGNLSREEVRDDPHSHNRRGGNRGGVARTAAPLRPQAGSISGFRPFVVDRNIRHFLWYGGVAGDGLRSVGVSPPSKSVCSILPIAICGPGFPQYLPGYGAPALRFAPPR
jgi:predicted MFS family arabinose efflux permease